MSRRERTYDTDDSEDITANALRECGADFDHDPETFKPYIRHRWLLGDHRPRTVKRGDS